MSEFAETDDLKTIESRLGHVFRKPDLLESALTRRSFWHENRDTCSENNERMEFLGDAVLGLVIADILYHRYPDSNEGDLQKRRASIVNRSALARLMRTLGLAQFIRMGKGDEISGCRDRDSILADTLEAIIAAIFIDSGFSRAYQVVERHFFEMVEYANDAANIDDSKSRLQEHSEWGRCGTVAAGLYRLVGVNRKSINVGVNFLVPVEVDMNRHNDIF